MCFVLSHPHAFYFWMNLYIDLISLKWKPFYGLSHVRSNYYVNYFIDFLWSLLAFFGLLYCCSCGGPYFSLSFLRIIFDNVTPSRNIIYIMHVTLRCFVVGCVCCSVAEVSPLQFEYLSMAWHSFIVASQQQPFLACMLTSLFCTQSLTDNDSGMSYREYWTLCMSWNTNKIWFYLLLLSFNELMNVQAVS